MPLYTGVGGVVKEIKELGMGVGGVVKKGRNGYVGVNGVIKPFYSSDPLDQLTGFELRLESWSAYYVRNYVYQDVVSQPPVITTEYDLGDSGNTRQQCIIGDANTHTLTVWGYHYDNDYNYGYTEVKYNLYSKNLPVEKNFKELMEELNSAGKLSSFSFTVPRAFGYHNSSYPSLGGSVDYSIFFGKNLSLSGNYPLRNYNAVVVKNDMFGENGYWEMQTTAYAKKGEGGNSVFSECEIQFPQSVNINGKSYPITFKSLIKGVSI